MLQINHHGFWVRNLWDNGDADFIMILIVFIVTVMVKSPDIMPVLLGIVLILVVLVQCVQERVL